MNSRDFGGMDHREILSGFVSADNIHKKTRRVGYINLDLAINLLLFLFPPSMVNYIYIYIYIYIYVCVCVCAVRRRVFRCFRICSHELLKD